MGTAARTKLVNLHRATTTTVTGFTHDDVLTATWDAKRQRMVLRIITSNGIVIFHDRLTFQPPTK